MGPTISMRIGALTVHKRLQHYLQLIKRLLKDDFTRFECESPLKSRTACFGYQWVRSQKLRTLTCEHFLFSMLTSWDCAQDWTHYNKQ